MTSTPKAVILAVIVFLGLIVLAVLAGEIALRVTGNGDMPDSLVTLAAGATGGLAGLLASTRSTPEMQPGTSVTTGASTVTGPPPVDPTGEVK